MSTDEISEPKWLLLRAVKDLHDHGLDMYGGASGVREPNQLSANIERPKFYFHYGETRIPALAAWYAIAFAKTQCFVDGNKRTAAFTAITFLVINGYQTIPDSLVWAEKILDISNGEISPEEFVEWVVSVSTEA